MSWEDLPSDLATTIFNRFNSSYTTCIRFGAVCKSWREIYITNKTKRPQIPWLMLPFKGDGSTLRGFYCPVDKRIYYLDQPAGAKSTITRGSFHGWIVNREDGPGIQLMNPLDSKMLIHLPPITSFPYVIDYDPNRVNKEYHLQCERRVEKTYYLRKPNVHVMYVEKVCVSSAPSPSMFNNDADLSRNCVFMAIYGEYSRLAFCKAGNENWSLVSTVRNHGQFEDVVFHNGKFYAGRLNMILECDLKSLQKSRPILVESPFKRDPPDTKIYLSIDEEGGLMMIVRFFTGKGRTVDDYGRVIQYHTIKFELFKLVLMSCSTDDNGGVMYKCRKISSLGDKALFLGANSPILVSTSTKTHQGIERNRIYYTDNYWEQQKPYIYGGFDIGVFNLENGSVEAFEGNKHYPSLVWPPPVWVLPNLC